MIGSAANAQRLLSHAALRRLTPDMLDVTIAGVGVRIRCSPSLLPIVHQILRQAARPSPEVQQPLVVEVRDDDGVWSIVGDAPRSKKLLRAKLLPQVAGAVVASVLAEIGQHTGIRVGRATVVEHRGSALIMVGDDWESTVVLAAHLHTRGWRFLGGDYVLVAPDGLHAVGIRKSLHVNSRALSALPLRYREAVEASPWYSTGRDIAFYAVDPTLVAGHSPWADSARIRAILRVDGHLAASPSLENIGGDFELADGLHQLAFAKAGVAVAMLLRGDFVETCNLVERWFATLPRDGN